MNSTKKQPTAAATERRKSVVAEHDFPLTATTVLRLRCLEYVREDGSTYLALSSAIVQKASYFGKSTEETYWLDVSPESRRILMLVLGEASVEDCK